MSSIKDIAKLAGVGISTVSRVMREEGYVSKKTRARVEQLAKELGYVPNGPARSMRGRPTRTIGVLVYDILNPFFANLVAGVEEQSYLRGFNVIMCSTQPWRNPEREVGYLQMLIQKKVDGLVTQHRFSSPEALSLLEQHGMPIVRLVSPQAGFDCDLVRCDTGQAGYELVSHLILLGHRQIAALGPNLPSTLGEERLAGYKRAIRDSGLEVRDELVKHKGWRTRDGYEMCCELLDNAAPDAIFAFGPRIAVGAACALREREKRVPDDIALVCVDDFGMGSDLDPFMTVARQPEVEMGSRAAGLLIERILKAYVGPSREIVLPAKLIVRRSSGSREDHIGLAADRVPHVWEDD